MYGIRNKKKEVIPTSLIPELLNSEVVVQAIPRPKKRDKEQLLDVANLVKYVGTLRGYSTQLVNGHAVHTLSLNYRDVKVDTRNFVFEIYVIKETDEDA